MPAPNPGNSNLPAEAVQAFLMAWDEAQLKFVPATLTGGKLDSTATVATTDAPATGTITSVASSATSVTVLASNALRKGAAIFNDSTQLLYLALSTSAASTTVHTVQIPPSSYYELPICDGGVYTGQITGIWAAANGSARVTELV